MAAERCGWCGRRFTAAEISKGKRWCSPAHSQAARRTRRAMNLADLVENLRPFITDEGMPTYQKLVESLAGRVNEFV